MANMAAFANNAALQDEASSASHASSSRVTSSMNTISSGSQSKIQYQPLSMADALARTGHDQVLALDQLLAERNKLCLEANKLSTENMRLWNMMKRIRRENEELKNNNGTLRNSPLSNGSQIAGSNNAFPSSSSSATIGGAASNLNPGSTGQSDALSSTTHTLSTSSTAPTLSLQQASTNLSATDHSGAQLESQKSSLYGSAPSATGHSIFGEGSEPRGSFTSNEVQEQSSASNVPASTSTATVHPDTALISGPLNNDTTQGIGLSIDSDLANNQSSDSAASHSQQHQSIMQQRAAAQAQRLAQIQSLQKVDDGARPSSSGSHDFDAVDASSMAGSEGARNSMRFSGDSGNNRGLQARVVPPSPLAISSPTMQSTSGGKHWSTDSPRNSFSPRLDAGLLPFVNLSVSGSNLRASERGKEIVSFYIAIDVKPPQGRIPQYSSWRVEKTYSDVLNLDARIKQKHGKTVSKRMTGVQLPDQTLFKDHAPSKVDKRKAMLELYLRTLITIPLPDKDDLCTFFCTDALQPKIHEPDALTKEGFLTKKGQNLGRWVTRWYVLSETSLDHYEWRNGLHLGSINIRGAQIGRQQKSVATDTDENSYRHAFLILETKAPSSTSDQKQIIRHVLCAETDEERDDWVEVLVRAIGEADNRDNNSVGGVDPINPYSSPMMPASATRSAFSPSAKDPGAADSPSNVPIQIDEVKSPITTGEEENLIASGGIPKSPSALPSTTQRPSREYSPFAAAPNSPHGVSPQISMPRSRSEVVGLQSSQEDRSMRTRHANLAAITASPGLNTQSGQGYQPGNRNTAIPGSPIRPPPRSTSQDVPSNTYGMVTSSSSAGHGGATYDNGTYRTSSPGVGGGGTGDERQSISSSGPRMSKDRARPSISGPMNGTPIPTGYKFGGKDEPSETSSNKTVGAISSSKHDGANAPNETKRRFWHRFGGGGDKSNQNKKVFGVPLAESIAVSNVSEGLELPSVVYRCIEYLEHHNAASEEGIYRLSGSSAVIKNLKDRFNAQGDVNLLASNEPFFDPHAIAGLLKQYLRELPSSVLTRELHLDFMRVNDLADRRERVNELGSLVSLLPLANYSLLRTLCSHLIKVIERSDVNKMTMRNVGIVFSPTLGIPAGVFALFLTEFDWVFYTDAKGEPAPRTMEEDILPPDEYELGLASKIDGSPQVQPLHQRNAGSFEDDFARKPMTSNSRNNRNSLSYNEMEADRLLGGPQARNRLSSYLEEVNGESANAFDDAKNAQSYPDDGLEEESFEESQGASIGNEVQQNFKSQQPTDYSSSNHGHNGPVNSHTPRLEGEITRVNQPYIRNTTMSPPQPSVRS